jgi:hypothetical protein
MNSRDARNLWNHAEANVAAALAVANARDQQGRQAREIVSYLFQNNVLYLVSARDPGHVPDKPLLRFERGPNAELIASSVKPSNIVVNLGNLLRAVGSGATAILSHMSNPLLCVTAILMLIQDLVKAVTVNIPGECAYVLLAVWNLRHSAAAPIAVDEETNRIMEAYGHSKIPRERIKRCLDMLVTYECINISLTGIYRVNETVRFVVRGE